jgi:hypothetical protein
MPTIIEPTIGRIVWFYLNSNSEHQAAIIAHVWSDTCVNLCVIDPNGVASGATSIRLLHEGDGKPSGSYCEWMPYQKGQAAKTEAAEAAARNNSA